MAWPTSEIAVMGPAGAANIIFRKDPDKDARTAEYIEEFATPYKAAERGYIDMVITPSETRPYIITALNALSSKREDNPAKKHGNIPLRPGATTSGRAGRRKKRSPLWWWYSGPATWPTTNSKRPMTVHSREAGNPTTGPCASSSSMDATPGSPTSGSDDAFHTRFQVPLPVGTVASSRVGSRGPRQRRG